MSMKKALDFLTSPSAVIVALLALWILFAVATGGCGPVREYVDFAVCYVHPEYGKVCVEFDGKLHFSADVQGDPLKLAAVTDWLKSKGVEIPGAE
jgi:hypothetical protein